MEILCAVSTGNQIGFLVCCGRRRSVQCKIGSEYALIEWGWFHDVDDCEMEE